MTQCKRNFSQGGNPQVVFLFPFLLHALQAKAFALAGQGTEFLAAGFADAIDILRDVPEQAAVGQVKGRHNLSFLSDPPEPREAATQKTRGTGESDGIDCFSASHGESGRTGDEVQEKSFQILSGKHLTYKYGYDFSCARGHPWPRVAIVKERTRVRLKTERENALRVEHIRIQAPQPSFYEFVDHILSIGLSHYRSEIIEPKKRGSR